MGQNHHHHHNNKKQNNNKKKKKGEKGMDKLLSVNCEPESGLILVTTLL